MKRLVLAMIAVALLAHPALASAETRPGCLNHPPVSFNSSCTITPYFKGAEPQWMPPFLGALQKESTGVARKWHSNSAYPDVMGIPIYVGTGKQLTALGCFIASPEVPHNGCAYALTNECDWGMHFLTSGSGGIAVITSVPKSCLGKAAAAHVRAVCPHTNFGGGQVAACPRLLEDTISHEVFEALVDPAAGISQPATPDRWETVGVWSIKNRDVEICDKVNYRDYYITSRIYQRNSSGTWVAKPYRVWMSDWLYPSYFNNGSFPYDHNHKVLSSAAGTFLIKFPSSAAAGGGLTPEDRSDPCESFSRPRSWARKELDDEAPEAHAGADHP